MVRTVHVLLPSAVDQFDRARQRGLRNPLTREDALVIIAAETIPVASHSRPIVDNPPPRRRIASIPAIVWKTYAPGSFSARAWAFGRTLVLEFTRVLAHAPA